MGRSWQVPSMHLRVECLMGEATFPVCTVEAQIEGSYSKCNGHYNRTPDLGKCGMWWNVWDLARHTILDTKVLDRNVTWRTRHKDTC